MTWLGLFGLLLLVAFIVYGFRPFEHWRLRHIPGPWPVWLFGNALEVRRRGRHSFGMQLIKPQWPLAKVFFGARSFVWVDSPELCRKVMLHSSTRVNVSSGHVLPQGQASYQSSILYASGPEWKGLRSAWQPMFFSSSLQGYRKLMDDAAGMLVEELEEAAKQGRTLNIHKVVGDMTFNVVGTAAFGVNMHTQKKDRTVLSPEEAERCRRVREAAERSFSPNNDSAWVMLGVLCPFLVPLIRLVAWRFPDKLLKDYMEARMTTGEMAEQLIREHMASIEAKANNAHQTTPGSDTHDHSAGDHAQAQGLSKGVAAGSFVDLLVKGRDRATGQAFSDAVLGQQAIMVILAGYDTTANALSFASYLLSHPDNASKQAKLVAEVDAFGRDRDPTVEDLDTLPYLDGVIKEALRLFPPAYLTTRMAEDTFELAGKRIDKGQWIIIGIMAMHRKHWPQAERFLPERWIPGTPEHAAAPKNAFIPFGSGPRVCVGSRFALQEAKLTLIRIFQRLTLKLAPFQASQPLELQSTITLSPKDGVWVKPVQLPQLVTMQHRDHEMATHEEHKLPADHGD